MDEEKDRILHIANDFLNSKVYVNLYEQIDREGYQQIVFAPFRNKNQNPNEVDFRKRESKIVLSAPVKKIHRLFFLLKIRMLYNSLTKQIDFKHIRLIHATTLFSDGALAYKIYKKYSIPYIVTIRTTDVDIFLKYRSHLIPLAEKILSAASHVVFVSEALKSRFINHPKIQFFKDRFLEKSHIIYNGIEAYWLQNLNPDNQTKENKFLYVGKFNKNKNVLRLIQALAELRMPYSDIQLGLVGGGGNQQKQVLRAVKKHADWINYYGSIKEPSRLAQIFRDYKFFAMISHTETFGLVYLEALSQGLPLIHTENQGIDSVFAVKVGHSALADSTQSIKEAAEYLIQHEDDFELKKIDFNAFSWNRIAKAYIKLYNNVEL